MPFGLCNAPNTFQWLMNTVFEKELNFFILVYLDDILVYSRSIGEHTYAMHLIDCVGLSFMHVCISANS